MKKIADIIRKHNRHYCSIVVVAAGSSTRMGEDKLKLKLGTYPVLALTLKMLQEFDCVDEIIVVSHPDKVEETAKLCRDYGILKAAKVMMGGATRTESALLGVCSCSQKAEIIGIHDGARPFIDEKMVSALIHNAVLYNAAAPYLPLKDTVKFTEDGYGVETPDRNLMCAVQTPQVFNADIIKAALSNAQLKDLQFSDDCAAVEALGQNIKLVPGDEENIKITVPLDYELAKLIYNKKQREGLI